VSLRSAIAVLLFVPLISMATERPKYRVLRSDGDCELRRYEPYIVAKTVIDTADMDEASTQGFRRLAGYIFGGNRAKQTMAMTAPVTTGASEKIAMTAPVETHRQGTSMVMTFMMPSVYTLETLPEPNDPRIVFETVPARTIAVVSFSGRWTEENFTEQTRELQAWIAREHLQASGEPVVARYDPPFMPSFFRHNEIQIPVREPS
jgi:hypothetical protein